MDRIAIFAVLSISIIIISWRTLFTIKSHGFYRFFSWEGTAWLLAVNYKFWFENPFSVNQIISWILLIISGYLVIAGLITMKKFGKQKEIRDDKKLYKFEKTTELVDKGIFKYIRHPLYSSLMFLTWGILFKSFTFELLFVSIISTIFLFLTSLHEEKECLHAFGDEYSEYMKKSKRFIPFII